MRFEVTGFPCRLEYFHFSLGRVPSAPLDCVEQAGPRALTRTCVRKAEQSGVDAPGHPQPAGPGGPGQDGAQKRGARHGTLLAAPSPPPPFLFPEDLWSALPVRRDAGWATQGRGDPQ